jgi:hypothetical protein
MSDAPLTLRELRVGRASLAPELLNASTTSLAS